MQFLFLLGRVCDNQSPLQKYVTARIILPHAALQDKVEEAYVFALEERGQLEGLRVLGSNLFQ